MLAVLMLHCAIVFLLMREAARNFGPMVQTEPLIIEFLSRTISRHETAASPVRRIEAGHVAANPKPAVPLANAVRRDDALSTTTSMPSVPPVDWTAEAEIASRKILQAAETDKGYRNLAGLSAAQMEWAKKMHLVPMNTESPFAAKHEAHCVFIGPVFFCEMKIGIRKPRGDLFKNMREYLDERLTDPLP